VFSTSADEYVEVKGAVKGGIRAPENCPDKDKGQGFLEMPPWGGGVYTAL